MASQWDCSIIHFRSIRHEILDELDLNRSWVLWCTDDNQVSLNEDEYWRVFDNIQTYLVMNSRCYFCNCQVFPDFRNRHDFFRVSAIETVCLHKDHFPQLIPVRTVWVPGRVRRVPMNGFNETVKVHIAFIAVFWNDDRWTLWAAKPQGSFHVNRKVALPQRQAWCVGIHVGKDNFGEPDAKVVLRCLQIFIVLHIAGWFDRPFICQCFQHLLHMTLVVGNQATMSRTSNSVSRRDRMDGPCPCQEEWKYFLGEHLGCQGSRRWNVCLTLLLFCVCWSGKPLHRRPLAFHFFTKKEFFSPTLYISEVFCPQALWREFFVQAYCKYIFFIYIHILFRKSFESYATVQYTTKRLWSTSPMIELSLPFLPCIPSLLQVLSHAPNNSPDPVHSETEKLQRRKPEERYRYHRCGFFLIWLISASLTSEKKRKPCAFWLWFCSCWQNTRPALFRSQLDRGTLDHEPWYLRLQKRW